MSSNTLIAMVAVVVLALAASYVIYDGSARAVDDGTGDSDNGGTDMAGNDDSCRNVEVGEEFTISLKGNPTTGYDWVAVSYDGLNLVNDWYVTDDPGDPPRCGVGGVHHFKFSADKAGEYKVVLDYQRSWEGSCGNVKEFTIIVE